MFKLCNNDKCSLCAKCYRYTSGLKKLDTTDAFEGQQGNCQNFIDNSNIKYKGWLPHPIKITTRGWVRIAYTENGLMPLLVCADAQKFSYKMEVIK